MAGLRPNPGFSLMAKKGINSPLFGWLINGSQILRIWSGTNRIHGTDSSFAEFTTWPSLAYADLHEPSHESIQPFPFQPRHLEPLYGHLSHCEAQWITLHLWAETKTWDPHW
jgi:hypothetical protein